MALLGTLAPGARMPAHGGSSTAVTSDYRTTITRIAPAEQGLSATIVDVGGSVQLTWTGPGVLIVKGYQGEPYLRFDPQGIERNTRSPATYLNQNRYANVILPATADAQATPEWQRISSGHTTQWHDHRTHWMAPVLPAQVQADPGRPHLLEQWQIPLTVDGRPVTIDGRLSWIPPPSLLPWLGLGAGVAVLLGALLFTKWWRPAAIAAAAAGTAVYAVDGLGYLARAHRGMLPWVWAIGWPLVGVVAAVALAVQSGRASSRRLGRFPVSMAVAGLLVAVIGGIDRYDGLSNSQIFSAFPDWVARLATAVSFGIGAALVLRYLADLVPVVVTGRATPHDSHPGGQPGPTTS
jgi:hypothetical protein